MLEINFTFVIFALSFIVFSGLMKLVFFDPIKKVVNKREGFIEANIQASKFAQQKIEDQIKESSVSSILGKARQEAQKILSAALDTAGEARYRLVQEAITANKDLLATNLTVLNKETDHIRENLSTYVAELTKTSIEQFDSQLTGKERTAV